MAGWNADDADKTDRNEFKIGASLRAK